MCLAIINTWSYYRCFTIIVCKCSCMFTDWGKWSGGGAKLCSRFYFWHKYLAYYHQALFSGNYKTLKQWHFSIWLRINVPHFHHSMKDQWPFVPLIPSYGPQENSLFAWSHCSRCYTILLGLVSDHSVMCLTATYIWPWGTNTRVIIRNTIELVCITCNSSG